MEKSYNEHECDVRYEKWDVVWFVIWGWGFVGCGYGLGATGSPPKADAHSAQRFVIIILSRTCNPKPKPATANPFSLYFHFSLTIFSP